MKLKWKYIIVSLVLLVALFINLQVGSQFIGISKIISTLTGISDDYDFVVYNYRLPRMIISLIGGCLLGVSGAIVQSLLRNPLASPDIIGVTKGAGLFAVAQTLLLPALPFYFLGIASFIGAVVLIMLIMLIGKLFQASTYTIALIGVALSAICQEIGRAHV